MLDAADVDARGVVGPLAWEGARENGAARASCVVMGGDDVRLRYYDADDWTSTAFALMEAVEDDVSSSSSSSSSTSSSSTASTIVRVEPCRRAVVDLAFIPGRPGVLLLALEEDERVFLVSLGRAMRSAAESEDDLDSGAAVLCLASMDGDVTSIAVHPDGASVAVGDSTGHLVVIELETGETHELDGAMKYAGGRPVVQVIMTADGTVVATWGGSGMVAWTGDTLDEVHALDIPSASTHVVRLAAAGGTFVCGTAAGSAAIWDVASMQLVQVLEEGGGPDGRPLTAAHCDSSNSLLAMAYGDVLRQYVRQPHDSSAPWKEISAEQLGVPMIDANYIATEGDDATVQLCLVLATGVIFLYPLALLDDTLNGSRSSAVEEEEEEEEEEESSYESNESYETYATTVEVDGKLVDSAQFGDDHVFSPDAEAEQRRTVPKPTPKKDFYLRDDEVLAGDEVVDGIPSRAASDAGSSVRFEYQGSASSIRSNSTTSRAGGPKGRPSAVKAPTRAHSILVSESSTAAAEPASTLGVPTAGTSVRFQARVARAEADVVPSHVRSEVERRLADLDNKEERAKVLNLPRSEKLYHGLKSVDAERKERRPRLVGKQLAPEYVAERRAKPDLAALATPDRICEVVATGLELDASYDVALVTSTLSCVPDLSHLDEPITAEMLAL